MVEKSRYGKIAVVIFLTVLIWVWADMARTETHPVIGATITVAKSGNPALLVSLDGDQRSISVRKIVLKGPTSRVDEVKRKLRDGLLSLEFFLEPEAEGMTTAGSYTLAVLEFLKKNDQIKQLGLTVESCQPETLSVNVLKLVKKSLDVSCVDEEQIPIKGAIIEPARVEMLVPEDWEGEKLVATVSLSRGEIEQGRVSAIEKTPYIRLAAWQIKEASETVKIIVPVQQDRLNDYTIIKTTPGFLLSVNLQGKYAVEIINPEAVMGAITIKATAEAKRAYEKMIYQVILEIDDTDAKSAEPIRKELVYNFPAEFSRKDEIRLNQQPVTARFKLKKLGIGEAEGGVIP